MSMVLIGSRALRFHFNDVPRTSSDLDIIGDCRSIDHFVGDYRSSYNLLSAFPVASNKTVYVFGSHSYDSDSNKFIIEAELATPFSSGAYLLRLLDKRYGKDSYYHADPWILYTIKMSHRYLKNSPAFLKTMEDIHFLRGKGYDEIPDYLQGFYELRMEETYNYAHPKLDVTKQDFFTGDNIVYTYDHDSLHEAVKLGDKPAYRYFKPDDNEVMVSKAMFDSLPGEIKINSVLEEAYVLALERSQIPFPGVLGYEESFLKALEKVCTSITSGWWREFAWENYYNVAHRYSNDYITKFRLGLESGVVKPYVE